MNEFFGKKASAKEHFGCQIHILEGFSITWHHSWWWNANKHSCHPTQRWNVSYSRQNCGPAGVESSELSPSLACTLHSGLHCSCQIIFILNSTANLDSWQQLLQVTDPVDGGFEGIILAVVTTNHIRICYNSGVRARGDIVVVEIDSIFTTPDTTPTWT